MKHLPIVLPLQKLESILVGWATHLRVPLDPQPAPHLDSVYLPGRYRKGFDLHVYSTPSGLSAIRKYLEVRCPYGKRGDLLYVQKEWSPIGPTSQDLILRSTTHPGAFTDRYKEKPWQPAATMPKKAARLRLKVTQVRIYQVNPIAPADALAQGPMLLSQINAEGFAPAYRDYTHASVEDGFIDGTRVAFRRWFMSVYRRDFLDVDPWVWVISFQRTRSPLNS